MPPLVTNVTYLDVLNCSSHLLPKRQPKHSYITCSLQAMCRCGCPPDMLAKYRQTKAINRKSCELTSVTSTGSSMYTEDAKLHTAHR